MREACALGCVNKVAVGILALVFIQRTGVLRSAPCRPTCGIDSLWQSAVDEHRAAFLLPWSSKSVSTISHSFCSRYGTVAEEETRIEIRLAQLRIHHLRHRHAAFSRGSDVSAAFYEMYVAVVEPFHAAVVDEVSCSFYSAVGEISS